MMDATAPFDPIEDVLEEMRAGRPVIVTDDADRENEGDLILAAEKATPESIAFMVKHTSGVICVPMDGAELDRLELPLMTPLAANTERMRTAYTISVDAAEGVTTGISAADRARTIRLLAEPGSQAADFARPGHVFPLRYREGGVLRRAGHTEASVDLARMAGLQPAGVLAEIVNDDGTMARVPELLKFKADHGLKFCTIEALIAYRRSARNSSSAWKPSTCRPTTATSRCISTATRWTTNTISRSSKATSTKIPRCPCGCTASA